MINFPDNPTVGQAFLNAGTIYTCVSITPIVWNAAPAAAGIPDAPTGGLTYGRNNAAWKALTKSDVGLANVDNTADLAKPISTATQAALNTKEPTLAASVAANYYRGDKTWQTLNKAAVGLSVVDNTADASKTVQSALYMRSGANPAGSLIPFSWADDGTTPTYFWGGNNVEGRVYHRNVVQVGYASNAGYASNSGQVGGIGGWAYRNDNYNPAYLWATQGDAQNQFLVQPGNLSVNWAGSCGTAGYCSGTAENANTLQGVGLGGLTRADWISTAGLANNSTQLPYFRKNDDGQILYLVRNTGEIASFTRGGGPNVHCYANSGGEHGFWALTGPSDIRLKRDVAPSTRDALADFSAMEFIQYRYNDKVSLAWDQETLHEIGFIGHNLKSISEQYVTNDLSPNEYLAPNHNELLAAASKAIQQLIARVISLEDRMKQYDQLS